MFEKTKRVARSAGHEIGKVVNRENFAKATKFSTDRINELQTGFRSDNVFGGASTKTTNKRKRSNRSNTKYIVIEHRNAKTRSDRKRRQRSRDSWNYFE